MIELRPKRSQTKIVALMRRIAGFAANAVVLLPCMGWLAVGLARVTAAEVPASKEYQLKAAFLYNFAKFVEWPAESFPDAGSPLVIGVFGQNRFGDELEKTVANRKIGGRPIVVKPVPTAVEAGTVHLLFVSGADDARLNELKGALRGASVLTVGESEAFARQDGIITFVPEGDKLRFEINLEMAEEARLKISAQLLKLAKVVRKKT